MTPVVLKPDTFLKCPNCNARFTYASWLEHPYCPGCCHEMYSTDLEQAAKAGAFNYEETQAKVSQVHVDADRYAQWIKDYVHGLVTEKFDASYQPPDGPKFVAYEADGCSLCPFYYSEQHLCEFPYRSAQHLDSANLEVAPDWCPLENSVVLVSAKPRKPPLPETVKPLNIKYEIKCPKCLRHVEWSDPTNHDFVCIYCDYECRIEVED